MNSCIRTTGLLMIALLFLVLPRVKSQEGHSRMTLEYFNKTEIGAAIGFGSFIGDIDSGSVQRKLKNDQLIIPIQTINGFLISGRLGIGLGLGVEPWKEGLFYPVFGHLFYDFTKGDNIFYGCLSIGNDYGKRYETSYYAEGKGGMLFSIGAGYRMKVLKRLQFLYEIFYRYQAIESTYKVYYDAARTKFSTVDEKFPYNFAGFRIGIFFH